MLQPHRSSRTLLLLWLLGLLGFRFTFPIFTHNSVPLSAFLSLIFVLVPSSILLQIRRFITKKEHSLPLQKDSRKKYTVERYEKGTLYKALGLMATCWLYYYGLRVRHIDFDSEKVDTQGKYFLAVNFWDNEVMIPLPKPCRLVLCTSSVHYARTKVAVIA
jgi:hypothetical protein